MRSFALLALVTLAALPLSAHDHWRDRRPVMVVRESCRPADRWEERRWDDRWERRNNSRSYGRSYDRRYDCDDYRPRDCDDARVILRPLLRPLAPPFEGRVVLRFR